MYDLQPAFVDDLREATDFLDRLRETGVFFPQPSVLPGDRIEFTFSPWQVEDWTLSNERKAEITVERFRAAARAIGGRWEKNDPKASSFDDSWYRFTHVQKIGGMKLYLDMQRDLVCERVQVGTKKVVKPAVEAQPEREVEEPVFERECKPLFRHADEELTKLAAELEAGDEIVEAELVE